MIWQTAECVRFLFLCVCEKYIQQKSTTDKIEITYKRSYAPSSDSRRPRFDINMENKWQHCEFVVFDNVDSFIFICWNEF